MIQPIRKGWWSGKRQQGAGSVAGINEQREPATAPAACCREEVGDTSLSYQGFQLIALAVLLDNVYYRVR